MQATTQAAVATTGTQPLVEASQPGRLVSLDVFRGLTVLVMILVNNPGDWGHIYPPLAHAAWHGCTVADLVFPFFLFIVGVSTVYALASAKRSGAPRGRLLLRVARRAAVLVGLGVLLALIPYFEFSTVRLPGVLQRIGLVFLACGTIFLTTSRRTQLWLLAGILVGYNVLEQLVPPPDAAEALLLPGRDLGAWLDRLVFGEAHLWKFSRIWDPEGLLSTVPAVASGLLGVITGQWLRRPDVDPATKVVWLFVDAGLLIVLGLIWNEWFPINKSLWTSSYVLYTGGMAVAGLATLYWLCDVQGWRRFVMPFMVFGVNAITAFFLSSLVARTLNLVQVTQPDGAVVSLKSFLYESLFAQHIPNPYLASFAGAAVSVLIWMGVLWGMYSRRIIIKV